MGITIDKSILYMSLYKQRLEESISDGLEEDIEAYDVAMNTMRKYQKIEKIFLKWHDNWSYQASMAMSDIEKVVEDGNDD